jgi:hypothetical protein
MWGPTWAVTWAGTCPPLAGAEAERLMFGCDGIPPSERWDAERMHREGGGGRGCGVEARGEGGVRGWSVVPSSSVMQGRFRIALASSSWIP